MQLRESANWPVKSMACEIDREVVSISWSDPILDTRIFRKELHLYMISASVRWFWTL